MMTAVGHRKRATVVTNDAGEILLQRRSDNDLWALPGGTMDLGERIAETVVA